MSLGPGCGKENLGDYPFHAVKGRKMLSQGDEGWTSNFEAGVGRDGDLDESAQLRERARQLAERRQQEGDQPPGGGPPRVGPPGKRASRRTPTRHRRRKEEREEESEGHRQRQACCSGGAEGIEGDILWHRAGAQGKSTPSRTSPSPKTCVSKKDHKQQQWVLEQQQQFLEPDLRGLQGVRVGLLGGDKGQGRCREVPRGPHGGSGHCNAKVFTHDQGRRGRKAR